MFSFIKDLLPGHVCDCKWLCLFFVDIVYFSQCLQHLEQQDRCQATASHDRPQGCSTTGGCGNAKKCKMLGKPCDDPWRSIASTCRLGSPYSATECVVCIEHLVKNVQKNVSCLRKCVIGNTPSFVPWFSIKTCFWIEYFVKQITSFLVFNRISDLKQHITCTFLCIEYLNFPWQALWWSPDEVSLLLAG